MKLPHVSSGYIYFVTYFRSASDKLSTTAD